jgi:hypothetical protein
MTEPTSHNPGADTTAALTDEALEAFWQVVMRRYPETMTGDLSPWTFVRLQEAAEETVREWVWANAPTPANE